MTSLPVMLCLSMTPAMVIFILLLIKGLGEGFYSTIGVESGGGGRGGGGVGERRDSETSNLTTTCVSELQNPSMQLTV